MIQEVKYIRCNTDKKKTQFLMFANAKKNFALYFLSIRFQNTIIQGKQLTNLTKLIDLYDFS